MSRRWYADIPQPKDRFHGELEDDLRQTAYRGGGDNIHMPLISTFLRDESPEYLVFWVRGCRRCFGHTRCDERKC